MSSEPQRDPETNAGAPGERTFVHRILRYVPNPLRDEWVNIGVLLYDPATGERRLRLIEDEEEYLRVRQLHPRMDEEYLRGLRDELEGRIDAAPNTNGNGANGSGANAKVGPIRGVSIDPSKKSSPGATDWLAILEKWYATLSQSLQLAEPKATTADDLDAEIDRLYDRRVAIVRAPSAVGAPRTRTQMREYCAQVFKQAGVWDRIEKSVHASEFTYKGDPMRLDFGYRRNGTRGFVQTFPVTVESVDPKPLVFTAERAQQSFRTEFTAVTDVPLSFSNHRHASVLEAFRNFNVAHVPLEGFAVWVAELRPMLQ